MKINIQVWAAANDVGSAEQLPVYIAELKQLAVGKDAAGVEMVLHFSVECVEGVCVVAHASGEGVN